MQNQGFGERRVQKTGHSYEFAGKLPWKGKLLTVQVDCCRIIAIIGEFAEDAFYSETTVNPFSARNSGIKSAKVHSVLQEINQC